MKKVRTPDEIEIEITHLECKLKELREELHISDAINNPSHQEYKYKWVFHNAYESGWSCVYVLGVTPGEDMRFYGFGVEYNEQTKILKIVSRDYPEDFDIWYPDNLTIMEEDAAVRIILGTLLTEFKECFQLNESGRIL